MLNRMRSSILTLCFGAIAVVPVKAQSPLFVEPPGWGLGVNFGLADLWGDVGTKSIKDHYFNGKYFDKPHFMGGIFARYSFHPSIAVRMGVNYGTLYANDNWNEKGFEKATSIKDDYYQRYIRNLDIKTNIWEGHLLLELTPLRLFNLEGKLAGNRFQPYFLAGIGGFHFKPTSEHYFRDKEGGGKWTKINDLHLEGQGFKFDGAPERYELWQMSAPLGIGVRWDVGYQLSLGIEYLYRMTFFDYLDGVSGNYVDPGYFEANLTPANATHASNLHDKSWLVDPSISHYNGDVRGNSAVNDGYSTISITLCYKIRRKADYWW